MAGEVIDLRGSPTGLEGLGEGLAALIGALMKDPDDAMRKALFENPTLRQNIATAERERRRNIQTGKTPIDPRIGDASVPTEDIRLPVRPSGISPELMEEILTMSPPSAQERLRELAGGGSELEQAQLDVILAQGSEARLTRHISERNLRVEKLAEEGGLDDDARSASLILGQVLLKQSQEMTKEMMEEVQKAFDSSTEHERLIIAATFVNPTLAQLYMQRERFDRETNLTRLRASLSTDSPDVVEQNRWIHIQKMRQERDRIRVLINEVEGDKDRRDEIPGLVNDMQILARDMMRVDPSMGVTTANIIRGIIRKNKAVGVEFGEVDITDGSLDEVNEFIEALVEAGVTDSAKAFLEEKLKDPQTGRRNRLLEEHVITQAQALFDRRSPIYEEMNALAIGRAQDIMGNPDAVEANEQETTRFEEEYERLLRQQAAGNAPRNALQRLGELHTLISIHKRVGYFVGAVRETVAPLAPSFVPSPSTP